MTFHCADAKRIAKFAGVSEEQAIQVWSIWAIATYDSLHRLFEDSNIAINHTEYTQRELKAAGRTCIQTEAEQGEALMPTQTEILQFIVETQGNDELAATAKTLYDIAQGGGEAAPKAAALLDELGRLADVSSKTSGLPALKAQLQSVGDQLYTARVRAAELQTEFAATLEPTAALTRNYQKAQQAVAALELQQTQLGVAIKTSENALAAAGG